MRIDQSSVPGALFSTQLLYMAEHHHRLTGEISRGNTDMLLKQLQDQQFDGAIVGIRAMRPSNIGSDSMQQRIITALGPPLWGA